jgi:glycosyltransferase involved in cell wall biosynthesis
VKVLHVAETVVGGIATYLNYLNKFEKDVENVYLLPKSQHKYVDGVKFFYHRKGRDLVSLLMMFIGFIVTYYKVKPDIVFMHSSFAGLLRICCLVIPGLKKKVIYCSHGWSFDMKDKSERSVLIYGKVEKLLSYLTEKIICISKYEYKRATDVGINEKKLTVVYNCVGDELIEGSLQQDSEINTLLAEQPNFCIFVGRDSPQKAFDLLPEISTYLPDDLKIFVVGNLGEYQNTDKIHYLGWRAPLEVKALMENSQFLLCPSRWEGFGYVVVEAFKARIPVLASNRGALPELVREYKDGFIFDFDNLQTIESKSALILNPEHRTMMKKNLEERYKDFSFDKFREQIFEQYCILTEK